MSRVVQLVSRAALHGRAALALSLIGHRPWCPACWEHIKQVRDALEGASIQDMAAQHVQKDRA